MSRKRVEFSVQLGLIDGQSYLCVNAAYTGRGRRGFYIPTLCTLDPPPARFAVRDVAQPRQGVRGYALVIWGTAPPTTKAVRARFGRAAAAAAVFTVPAELSRRFEAPPFSVFVLELPLRATCGPIYVRNERTGAIQRIGRRAELCHRTSGERH